MIHPRKKWAIKGPGIILPVFFLSVFFVTVAQVTCPDAYSLARGEIYAVGPGEGPLICNPAILARQHSMTWHAGHSRPFALSEIGVSALTGILPVDPGSFRLQVSSSGIRGYRELNTELGYGLQLGESLSAGISFRYYNTTVPGDWNYLWTIGWGAGLLYAHSNASRIGIVILNPVTIGNQSAYGPVFPALIALGVSHLIYENTTVMAECAYSSIATMQVKVGMEYAVADWCTIACGFHSSPATYAFGAGISPGPFIIHIATAWSPLPGIHPSVLITWFPGK